MERRPRVPPEVFLDTVYAIALAAVQDGGAGVELEIAVAKGGIQGLVGGFVAAADPSGEEKMTAPRAGGIIPSSGSAGGHHGIHSDATWRNEGRRI
jgi:hypothetical protein